MNTIIVDIVSLTISLCSFTVHINVSLMEDGKPAKIGFKVENDKKIRYFKKSGNKVDEGK